MLTCRKTFLHVSSFAVNNFDVALTFPVTAFLSVWGIFWAEIIFSCHNSFVTNSIKCLCFLFFLILPFTVLIERVDLVIHAYWTESSIHAIEGDPPQIDFSFSQLLQFYHSPNVFLHLLPSYNFALFPLLSFWSGHSLFTIWIYFFPVQVLLCLILCNFLHMYNSKCFTKSASKSQPFYTNLDFSLFKQWMNISTISVVQRILVFLFLPSLDLLATGCLGVDWIGDVGASSFSLSDDSISFNLFWNSFPSFLKKDQI